MNKALKAVVGMLCLCLVVVCILVLKDDVKALLGRGIVTERIGDLDVTVSGCQTKCPCFVLSKANVPKSIAGQRPFSIGTNQLSLVVYVAESDHLYWLCGGNIGVTRYAGKRVWFSRWLLLSEINLNCTYDVQDDMKGLNATVSCSENDTEVKYVLKYEELGRSHEISIEVDRNRLKGSP